MWNVKKILDHEGSSNTERWTGIVAKYLPLCNIDIAALSEARLSDEDQPTETVTE